MKKYNHDCIDITEILSTDDGTYAMARRFMNRGFAIISVNASKLPDDFPIDLIGDTVNLVDFCYPETADEPMFDIEGYNEPVPMSSFDWAYCY